MMIGKMSNLDSAIYRLENVLSAKQTGTLKHEIREALHELYAVRNVEKQLERACSNGADYALIREAFDNLAGAVGFTGDGYSCKGMELLELVMRAHNMFNGRFSCKKI